MTQKESTLKGGKGGKDSKEDKKLADAVNDAHILS